MLYNNQMSSFSIIAITFFFGGWFQAAAANQAPTTHYDQCVTGYCGFVRCVRSVNADLLVRWFCQKNITLSFLLFQILRCYNESRLINTLTYTNQQVNFYKNITSCILARSRCSLYNPITGQNITSKAYISDDHHNIFWSKFQTPALVQLANTVQVTPSGELRIVALPSSVAVRKYFCSNQNNLMQSTWMSFVCQIGIGISFAEQSSLYVRLIQ